VGAASELATAGVAAAGATDAELAAPIVGTAAELAAPGIAAAGLADAELAAPIVGTAAELAAAGIAAKGATDAELAAGVFASGNTGRPGVVPSPASNSSKAAMVATTSPVASTEPEFSPPVDVGTGALLSGSVAVPRSSDAMCASGPSSGSRGSGARSAAGRLVGAGDSGMSGPASLSGSKGSRGTREAASIFRALQWSLRPSERR
jgi:hypothetical protein